MTQTNLPVHDDHRPVMPAGYRGDSLPVPARHLSDLEDVVVLPVEVRRFAHPETWVYDSSDETVALECEPCEETLEVTYMDEDTHPLNGDNCPRCGCGYTTRVIAAAPVRPWWFLLQVRPA